MTNDLLLPQAGRHGPPVSQSDPVITRAAVASQIPAFQLSVPLVPLIGQIQLPDDYVRRDGGSRTAVSLRASDQSDYYCKGPSLTPDHPYIGINEFLGGRLARLAGLPTRPPELIIWEGELFTGVEILPNDRKMSGNLSVDVWARLDNAPDIAYGVVAFDTWIMNEDRHDGNWLGAVTSATNGTFLVVDHDLALLGQGRSLSEFRARAGLPVGTNFVRSETIRSAVVSRAQLQEAVDSIARLNDAAIAAEVAHLPDRWANAEVRSALLDVLCARRDSLRHLLDGAPEGLFPNLQ